MKLYKIEVSKSAQKFLAKNKSVIYKRFESWTKKLAKAPYNENDGMEINRFIDNKQVYKKRIGSFRVFYIVYDDVVLITSVKSRGQAYKKK